MRYLLSGPSRTRMGRGPVHIEVQTELLTRTRLKRATPNGWSKLRLRPSSDCGGSPKPADEAEALGAAGLRE